jgi:hypothetical protein
MLEACPTGVSDPAVGGASNLYRRQTAENCSIVGLATALEFQTQILGRNLPQDFFHTGNALCHFQQR